MMDYLNVELGLAVGTVMLFILNFVLGFVVGLVVGFAVFTVLLGLPDRFWASRMLDK
jgi:hypothetical protein